MTRLLAVLCLAGAMAPFVPAPVRAETNWPSIVVEHAPPGTILTLLSSCRVGTTFYVKGDFFETACKTSGPFWALLGGNQRDYCQLSYDDAHGFKTREFSPGHCRMSHAGTRYIFTLR